MATETDKNLTQSVIGDYKTYCMYVHTPEYFTVEGYRDEDLRWYPSKFHKYLCDTVQEFIERPTDKAYEILVLSTPPQHGKSETITKTLPSWYLMKNPDKFVIEVSYGNDLAERFGKANLDKVKEYGRLFGVQPDPKKCTSQEFYLKDHTGGMISRGRGSSLTGYSGHLIVIDDPIKNREEADSETQRESLWEEFNDSIVSRHQRGTKIILIMTRWHEDDLVGRIRESLPEDIVTVINLPCEAEEGDLLGRKPGQALCPEIGKDDVWLREFKKTHASEHGLRSWNALYQGHPSAKEGNILAREWWKFYEEAPRFDTMLMSVDAAFKDGEQNDYVAITVWGKTDSDIYLVDLVNKHLNLTGTIRAIKMLAYKYPKIGPILIEDKANGPAIIHLLRDSLNGIIPVRPDVSKEARVNAVSFAIEAGNVYLPKNRKWTWEFIDQCAAFPNGKHDDMVDSMSQALSRLIFTRKFKLFEKKKKRGDRYFNFPEPAKPETGEAIHVI